MMHKNKHLIFKLLSILLITQGLGVYAYALESERWQEAASIAVTAVVAPYTTVKLSTNEITFDVRGEPGQYYSNEEVEVTVGSNQSTWSVYVNASDLSSANVDVATLPSSRLAFAINDAKEYKALEGNLLFLQGVVAQEPKPVKLRFRLTTTWQDAPGTYKGNITFSFLNNP